jgi:hypothetical protein
VWEAADGGRRLKFHLTGINNQNFLMEDEETGSWWQQIDGEAVHGPLRGHHLRLVASEETTFALFVQEHPEGQVLKLTASPGPRDVSANWEVDTARYPVPAGSGGGAGPLNSRTLIVGVVVNGEAKAYPVEKLASRRPFLDTVGGSPIVLLLGSDGRTVRVFLRKLGNETLNLFGTDNGPVVWIDAESASEWDFSGRAIKGPRKGAQLTPITAIQDFWFDWHNYHPATAVYTPR